MKAQLFREIINRFYFREKYKFYALFPLSLIASMFECFGLVLIFQFMLFLSNPNSQHCQKIVIFFRNELHTEQNPKIVFILGCLIALIYIVKNIYMLFFIKFSNMILQDLSVKITIKTVENILFQDYLKVVSTSKEQMVNILSKVEFVVWRYCQKYVNLIVNGVIAFALISYLFIKFALPALSAIVVIFLLSFVGYKFLKKKSLYQDKYFLSSFNELKSAILKLTNSLKEIRLNDKQNETIEKIEKQSKKYADLNNDRNFYNVFHIYFTEILIMFAFVLVLGVLFYTTNFDNSLLISSISTICVIILRLTPIINRIQSSIYSINSSKSVVLELVNFDKQFPELDKTTNQNEKIEFNKELELKNVCFKYDDKSQGLKDINLKINKGDFLGIVGVSGSYKTTLSLIISGLIKPQCGEIFLDNKKLMDDDIKKWQKNIGYLGQELEFDLEKLSCGQKQQKVFLELLYKDKDVLILDEITSAQDVISQEKMNALLKEIKNKKTIITIAHRFQILKHCNKIVFMDDGKIMDIGSFAELSQKHEKFKKMVELSKFEIS